MIANYFGIGVDLAELRRKHPASLGGSTLTGITAICRQLRLSSRAVRCGVDELRRLRTPCLLHWRFNHFVVLKSVTRRHVVLHDPARGIVRETLRETAEGFTGVALEISPGSGFRRSRKSPGLRLRALLPAQTDLLRTLAVGLVLALICELLLLASPFYLQIVIDEVLGNSDAPLLNTVAIGFALLLMFQVAANTLRQLTFQYLTQLSVFDITARILNRLLSLPLSFFRNRDLGDVQHRINALRRVQKFIIHSAPALILDALFVVLIVCIMAAYDFDLTFLAIVVAITWFCWRVVLYPISVRLADAIAHAEASVDTHFLETLRSVQTISLLGGESARLSEWRNLFAAQINQKIRAGNLAILDSAVRQFLLQGLRIVCIYALAKQALAGQMSVGMVSAFVAYLGMFVSRAGGIVDRLMEYRLLEVPLNRIADIVFGEESVNGGQAGKRTSSNRSVELRGVAFAYSPGDAWILKRCSCHIVENGFTVIAGPSGAGKSTLLRLVAGVERAKAGEILIGNLAIKDWQERVLRDTVASVFQGDNLLKGSLLENIALFDEEPDLGRVRSMARQAHIDAEIESLPMGYETRISDLGTSLSRGQVQRVLLARALYRRPGLLLLDEATSGLDARTERGVIEAIRRLDMTRIVVTHSDQMLAVADEVLWLHDGVLLSSRPELNV